MATVLLVEDRELVGQAIKLGLENLGARVTLVGDAENAWEELAAGNIFDVIVSDLVLPGISGIELIEKALRLNGDTKAILMSGHQQRHFEFSEAFPDNVEFLPKPFQTQHLFERIRSLLNEKSHLI